MNREKDREIGVERGRGIDRNGEGKRERGKRGSRRNNEGWRGGKMEEWAETKGGEDREEERGIVDSDKGRGR